MIFGIIGFVLGVILGIAITLGFMGLKDFVTGLIPSLSQKGNEQTI